MPWYVWAVMMGVLTALMLESRRIVLAVQEGRYSYAIGTLLGVSVVTVPLSLLFWWMAFSGK